MSKPISVGDLVMTVRWSHACSAKPPDKVPGTPFVVAVIDRTTCALCGADLGIGAGDKDHVGVPLAWLRRIDPNAELESEKRDEEIREPA